MVSRLLFFISLFGLFGLFSPYIAAKTDRPNIVLILADDLGWRDLEVYGSNFYETPNIDGIARNGLRFSNAYSSSPLCSPTRASIMTGLNPARLRFTAAWGHKTESVEYPEMPKTSTPDQPVVPAPSATRLSLHHKTIAEHLHASAYTSAIFGKWHLGWDEWLPEKQGFDIAMPGGSYALPPSYFPPYKFSNFDTGEHNEHIDHRLAREAVKFIKEQKDQPFFLFYSLFSVHSPYQADKNLIDKYKQKKKSLKKNAPQRNPLMAAMIEHMDDAVGTLLKGIQDAGIANNTIIIFVSDNGGIDWAGTYKFGPPVTDNAPLRGGKAQIYEGGVRVPLIISWPGITKKDSINHSIVSSEDIFSTILQLGGLYPDKDKINDGYSLLPLLINNKVKSGRESVIIHFPHYVPLLGGTPCSSIRKEQWKLINCFSRNSQQSEQYSLFDLEEDIGEQHDKKDKHPKIAKKLASMLNKQLNSMNALVPFENPDYKASSGL